MSRSPLDELELLLKRRAEKRRPYIAQVLKMAEDFITHSEDWIEVEARALEKEIEFLSYVVEEEQIAAWRVRLSELKGKFEDTLKDIRAIVQRARAGELKTLAQVVRKKTWSFAPEEEQAMDIVSLIIRAFNLARDFEELVASVEGEARRILRLRRLVRLEVGARSSS